MINNKKRLNAVELSLFFQYYLLFSKLFIGSGYYLSI